MEDLFIFQHNILYSCGHQKTQISEHYFPNHALGIVLSGETLYYTNNGTFVIKEGAICLMRRNELFKKIGKKAQNGEKPALISLFLNQDLLRQYAVQNHIPTQSYYKGNPMIDLTGNVFLKVFFFSKLKRKYSQRKSYLTVTI